MTGLLPPSMAACHALSAGVHCTLQRHNIRRRLYLHTCRHSAPVIVVCAALQQQPVAGGGSTKQLPDNVCMATPSSIMQGTVSTHQQQRRQQRRQQQQQQQQRQQPHTGTCAPECQQRNGEKQCMLHQQCQQSAHCQSSHSSIRNLRDPTLCRPATMSENLMLAVEGVSVLVAHSHTMRRRVEAA